MIMSGAIFCIRMMARTNDRLRMMIAGAVVALSVVFVSCIHDPVGGGYYLDVEKIKGGEKPTPPAIQTVETDVADPLVIIITFTSSGAIDPDTGNNSGLYYFIYYLDADPAFFEDEGEYYNSVYYVGYTSEAAFNGKDPKSVIVGKVNPAFHGALYFWMTSYDGGRESDHSNVVSIVIP